MNASFFDDWDLNRFPWAIVFPDGTLTTYGIEPGSLIVGPTSGPLRKILSILEEIAKKAGLKQVKTWTKRNPKAYAKLSGGVCVGRNITDGVYEYTFIKKVGGENE